VPPSPPAVRLTDWRKQLESTDEIERALAVSHLESLQDKPPFAPEDQAALRRRLLGDASPIVRISALHLDPGNESEAAQLATLWALVKNDPHPGVRGWAAMALLGAGALNDDAHWDESLALLHDPNWTVRWSVNRAWDRRYLKGPKFTIAWNPQDVKPTADKLIALDRDAKTADVPDNQSSKTNNTESKP
jgi:HEAT repeat protein